MGDYAPGERFEAGCCAGGVDPGALMRDYAPGRCCRPGALMGDYAPGCSLLGVLRERGLGRPVAPKIPGGGACALRCVSTGVGVCVRVRTNYRARRGTTRRATSGEANESMLSAPCHVCDTLKDPKERDEGKI